MSPNEEDDGGFVIDQEAPTHTVGIFITYRRAEPMPSASWAKLVGQAIRHAPFVIEAVTAADMKQVNNAGTQSDIPGLSTDGGCERIHEDGYSPRIEEDGPTSSVARTV